PHHLPADMASPHPSFPLIRQFAACAFACAVALVACGQAGAGMWDSLKEDTSISGYFKNETAYRFREPRSFTKMRNILSVDAAYRFSSRYELYGSAWAYYDLAYDLFDYRTISGRPDRDKIQP